MLHLIIIGNYLPQLLIDNSTKVLENPSFLRKKLPDASYKDLQIRQSVYPPIYQSIVGKYKAKFLF